MTQKKFNTLCIHGHKNDFDNTGAVSVPIYQSATFAHEGYGQSTGFDYSRLKNPTREHLEKTVATLEGGLDAIAFSTGMAAVSAVMELFGEGDHIIASEDLYGGSLRYFRMMGTKRGIRFTFLNTGDTEAVAAAVTDATKAIYVESPTNPMMQVTDIRAMGDIAKKGGFRLIVDNTFMTPYFQNPITLGADIVLHSGTKYLGGHNDTLAGVAVVTSREDYDRLFVIAKTLGACLSPFDSWLILRGIKTLPLRMERQQATAIRLAAWLRERSWVKRLYFIGAADNPSLTITKKQSTGYGGMISFEVDSLERVKALLDGVALIQFAESLGGVETLITYPLTQTHADVPEAEREAKGINDRLLRLSVGLEDPEDLMADLSSAAQEVDHGL